MSAAHIQLSMRSEQRALACSRVRLYTVGIFFALCFISLGTRLVDVTLGERSFMEVARMSFTGVGEVGDDAAAGMALFRGETSPDDARWQPAVPDVVTPRQNIVDRNGVILASSVPTRSLYAKPSEIGNPEAVLEHLAKFMPLENRKTLLRRLHSSAKFVWLKRHITPQEQEAMLWSGIPGLYLHDDYRRLYPHGRLFSHVLGYTNVDGAGLSGVEKYFNDALQRDTALTPLTLSLDARLQQSLLDVVQHQKLKHNAIGATGAIFHIPTAQARALVSLPDYNPNRPMQASAAARFNRLSVGQYELGSIFKTFTTALALEHGGISLGHRFDATQPIMIGGKKIRDFHAKKRVLNVPEIFAYSSNIGTVKLMQTVGPDRQRDFLTRLDMFKPVGIEFNERSTPTTRAQWRPIQSATISYGHGISVTPLHLLKGMLSMTGGGELRELTLLDDTVKPATHVMDKDTSATINRLLRAVVQHGTAGKADVAGYAVGGKTGTANKAINGRYHPDKKISSMAAAFPMPNPEYLMFVMLDEPHGTKDTFNFATAGWVAAPAISDLVRQTAAIVGIPPQYSTPQDSVDYMITTAAEAAKRNRYIRNASF